MNGDPFADPAFQAAVRAELSRIGSADSLVEGLAASASISPDQLLAALRATARGAGIPEFLANLVVELERDPGP